MQKQKKHITREKPDIQISDSGTIIARDILKSRVAWDQIERVNKVFSGKKNNIKSRKRSTNK